MKTIPYARSFIDERDIARVARVLRGDWITHGPMVAAFEEALCRYTGAKYAVAVSNGTTALHLAALACGIGNGDRAIVPAMSFVASANCVLYAGGEVDFADIDPVTYHIDLNRVESMLKSPARRNVKLIIPVHFSGGVADMAGLKGLADKHGIRIVEDAAHALGASYTAGGRSTKVGACAHSDAAVLSFHPIKHITTGEGGAVLTNDKQIFEMVKRLRHHGIVKGPGFYYDIPEIGFNYRITDFQCALGKSQLEKLDRMVKERRAMVARYNQAFEGLEGLTRPYEPPGTRASYHLYVIRAAGGRRNRLYTYLAERGISSQVNYSPIPFLSFYRNRYGHKPGDFPATEAYSTECLSLPLFIGLGARNQARVIKAVKDFWKAGK